MLVVDGNRKPLGWAQPERIAVEVQPRGPQPQRDVRVIGGNHAPAAGCGASSPSRRGVVVNSSGELLGTVTATDVIKAIEAEPHLETAR